MERGAATAAVMQVVEDEVHMIFECPLYDNSRGSTQKGFVRLFDCVWGKGVQAQQAIFLNIGEGKDGNGEEITYGTSTMMKRFFGQPQQLLLAKFVAECLETREAALSQSQLPAA